MRWKESRVLVMEEAATMVTMVHTIAALNASKRTLVYCFTFELLTETQRAQPTDIDMVRLHS